tara:strand:- start:34 stop:1239 length:1206 start_codon:yes stop_codon:yes gene_type:complete
MTEKNGIDARSGKKSHISDEDLVGIPKFYNEEHDFYSYNLFDFHKFGLEVKGPAIIDWLEDSKNYKSYGSDLQYRPRLTWALAKPNFYDDEIIEGVKCVDKPLTISNKSSSLKEIKKLYVKIMLEELLALKNECSLFFLSGGMDSTLLLLLAKSINLPMTCVYIRQDRRHEDEYIWYLKRRYDLKLDEYFFSDIDLQDIYPRFLKLNPALWAVGSGSVDLLLQTIASQDKYKEHDNVIVGNDFWGKIGSLSLRLLYKNHIKNITEFEEYNKIYGNYRPHEGTVNNFALVNSMKNIHETVASTIKSHRNLFNWETLTNKYVFKSGYVNRELYSKSANIQEEKIDLIKAIYKIPEQEICKEIDSMLTFSKSIITGLNRPEYAKLPNITNWMINYEKNRKMAIE